MTGTRQPDDVDPHGECKHEIDMLENKIKSLEADLRGYHTMMADRHRLLEENWELREKLICLEGIKANVSV